MKIKDGYILREVALLSEYDIDRAAAAADVSEFIGKMKSADLLEL